MSAAKVAGASARDSMRRVSLKVLHNNTELAVAYLQPENGHLCQVHATGAAWESASRMLI